MFDLVFIDATLIDGSGCARVLADVAVNGNTIALVAAAGSISRTAARQSINCDGLVLCPGFIDAHTHDEAHLLQTHPTGGFHPKLSQGITTVITGHCGISLAPLQTGNPPAPLDILGNEHFRFNRFSDYLQALQAHQPITHAACLIGHSTLRVKYLDNLDRPANGKQAMAMAGEVQQALDTGAWGLSTGVFYPPAKASTAQELIAVAKPLAAFGAPLSMHLRDEADYIDAALQEAFFVAQSVGCPLVISHHKLIGQPNHGRSVHTLGLIGQASRHMDVCLDCYPYAASSTMLLPEKIAGAKDIRITWSQQQPHAAGQSLFVLATQQGLSPQQMAEKLMPAGAVYFAMDEADVRRILSFGLTMIGSDGLAHDKRPHPRLWGSFPRVLGHYSREQGLFGLEQAVYKMTGLTAQRYQLNQPGKKPGEKRLARGLVQPGFAADLVLFDPATIHDRATFDDPTLPSQGIHQVYMQGHLVCQNGVTVANQAGQVLIR
jgi:N-acyl-D-amino-acid deacylase